MERIFDMIYLSTVQPIYVLLISVFIGVWG